MTTWPFSHCMALLDQHNSMLYDYWLSVLWDDDANRYDAQALTIENLRLLEQDVMEQQRLTD
jgi:hypothetical protein